ncbi:TRIGALACTOSYLDIACYLGLYCEROL chloroplastic [Micractinium conductrix]|uniref:TRIGALACTOSYLDIACYLGLYCEROL chloroplastic n=1 Tax=Micractinium conductrix TaxID=554055 RepID=A0A2P6VIW2_9CHLO|nr:TRIGALACTOSYLDIACYLGLYCEROL chloroplastic [Micractinium conductrix]|eukprot:PSC74041.1 TRIGALACTOSYLDIACYLGLYCEROL chloroplastic [Micractinium conductrix]
MQCSLAARQPLLRASWPTGGPPAASCSLVSCPRGFGRPLTLGSSSHALRQLLLAAAAAGGGGGPPRPVPPPPQQTAASTSSSDGDEEEARPGLFANILKPLSDFGIGRTSMVQGGVGLFIFSGIGFALMLIAWARGGQLGRRGQGYQAILEFPVACGITVGTPVRIRGVPVGGVLSVQPSLEKVDVLVEMKDATTVIPRNSLIEANQSGLIAEPLIDITPQPPVPDYKANPLDEDCEKEGLVVCHQGRIRGERGVALDDLVFICTKLARQMDAQGVDKVFDTMEAARAAIEEATPLLQQAVKLSDEILPLLTELRSGNLVGNVEALTQVAAEAAADIQRLQTEVLTENNVKSLRESVQTLTKTLQHIERITGDLGGLTSDKRVTANLKQLIEALSRLVVD